MGDLVRARLRESFDNSTRGSQLNSPSLGGNETEGSQLQAPFTGSRERLRRMKKD
jgi:hypothetical protein